MVDQTVGTQGRAGLTPFDLDPSIESMWRERAAKRIDEKMAHVRIELPTGLVVMARRMNLRWLWKHDLIPDPITAKVEEMISLIESDDPDAVTKKMGDDLQKDAVKAFTEWYEVLGAVWMACVVAPQFTDDPDREDAITPPYHIGSVDYFDKMYLYQWAQGVDRSVIDFLHEQSEALGELADKQSIRLSPTSELRVDRRGRFVVSDDGGPSDTPLGDIHPKPNRRARRARSAQTRKKQAHTAGAEVHSNSDT